MKTLSSFTIFLIVLVLTSCNADETEPAMPAIVTPTEIIQPDGLMLNETADHENTLVSSRQNNVLIVYFTWADNTTVDDLSAIDVDVTTSASVLPPGNTAVIAQ